MKTFDEIIGNRRIWTIGFDLDDVVWDSFPIIQKGIWDNFGIWYDKGVHTRYHFDIPGASDMKVYEKIKHHLRTIKPQFYGDAYDTLHHVYNITQQPLKFISARTFAHDESKKFLEEDLLVPFELITCPSEEKVDHIERLDLDYFVDDRFKTCQQCVDRGINTFCMNQPWNSGREIHKNNFRRITTLSQVLSFLR